MSHYLFDPTHINTKDDGPTVSCLGFTPHDYDSPSLQPRGPRIHHFLAEKHGLGRGAADFHPSSFTHGCKSPKRALKASV